MRSKHFCLAFTLCGSILITRDADKTAVYKWNYQEFSAQRFYDAMRKKNKV